MQANMRLCMSLGYREFQRWEGFENVECWILGVGVGFRVRGTRDGRDQKAEVSLFGLFSLFGYF